ncbi:MAG: RnfABCDGE type electron transport complex subunit D [Hyphomicrobiaceae bacterium]
MDQSASNKGQSGSIGTARRDAVALARELGARLFFRAPSIPTVAAPHVRDGDNVDSLLNRFVIASLPCWFIGLWNIGQQIAVAMQIAGAEALPGWRAELISAIGLPIEPGNMLGCWLLGLLYFLPVLVTALLVGIFWEVLFAAKRNRPLDEGVLSIAWLFVLILPPTITFFQVAYGMTIAMVFGKAIFGGTGRYLVSPPILGICVLFFSYSSVVYGPGTWVPLPGYEELTTLELAIVEGGVPALHAVDYTWWSLFIGNQPGPFGVTSALGCLLGAIYLIATGAASWRIMAGSLIGLSVTVGLLGLAAAADSAAFSIPWYWHAVLGGWAFGTVFLATDPTAAATTRTGRWVFGVLVGALTVLVRLTNPAYFEGVVFAILLASIFAPLCDHFVVERNIARRRARTEARP